MKKFIALLSIFLCVFIYAQKEFTVNYNNYGIQTPPSEEYNWGITNAHIVFNYNNENQIKIVVPKANATYILQIVQTDVKFTDKGIKYQEITLQDGQGQQYLMGLFDDRRYGCVILFQDGSKIGLFYK